MHDPVTALVVLLFSRPEVALWLAGAILLLAVGLIVLNAHFGQRPMTTALINRINFVGFDVARAHFVERFAEIDRLFSGAVAPPILARGWRTYRSLLARGPDGGFVTSIHAQDAFEPVDEPARALEWWANILVAIGLTITFLGIVAALSEATAAIAGGGASGPGIESALIGLLAIAATKFWTSIAGVLGSIILRLIARRWRIKVNGLAMDLYGLLDDAVEYAPPEKMMIEQMAVLRRLEAALAQRVPSEGPSV